MSLLDQIKTYNNSETITINNLLQLPFIESIIKNQFDIDSKSLDELCKSLITYSYLNINSNKNVDSILWIIGYDKTLFDEYFFEIPNVKLRNKQVYDFKNDIDKIIKCEFMQKLKNPPYTKEQLNVRFLNVDAIECVICNNLRLLSWANTDGRSILKNIKFNIDIYISTMFKIANENNHYEITIWMHKQGFDDFKHIRHYEIFEPISNNMLSSRAYANVSKRLKKRLKKNLK
jgi:hypothetical protein